MCSSKMSCLKLPVIMCSIVFFLTILGAEDLSAAYALTKGEVAAIQLNLYAHTAWKTMIELYDAPLLPQYNKTSGKITINLYGAQDKIGIAQQMIDMLLSRMSDEFFPYLKNMCDINLSYSDITIVYRNRNEEGALIVLVWENKEYKFPGN
jgi:hypothetical protein